jgi:hypothetical protein
LKPTTGVVFAALAASAIIAVSCASSRHPGGEESSGTDVPFQIVVSGVDDPFQPADQFNTPAAGSRYVAVRLSIVNVSSETQTIEPAVDFELVGWLDIAYGVTVLVSEPHDISAGGPTLGVMPPGASIEGLLPFQIPLSDSPRRLKFAWRETALELDIPESKPHETVPSGSG